jgi:aspartate racemase
MKDISLPIIRKKRRTFGIVGGIGPIADADLLFKLVKSTPATDDSEHFNIILEQQPLREKTVFAGAGYVRKKRCLKGISPTGNMI